jgi:hypothetical protein
VLENDLHIPELFFGYKIIGSLASFVRVNTALGINTATVVTGTRNYENQIKLVVLVEYYPLLRLELYREEKYLDSCTVVLANWLE